MVHEVLHPKNWKATPGYSNGVAATGRMVFTGGMIGWNDQQEFETDDFAGQVRTALQSIVAVLAEAGARPEHLVRLTWYVTDKREYLARSEEHTSELQSREKLVCRLLLEKKNENRISRLLIHIDRSNQ